MSSSSSLILSIVSQLLGLPVDRIDFKSSFLSLGGNSTKAITLSTLCKRRGVALSVASILTSKNLLEIFRCATPIEEDESSGLHDRRSGSFLERRPASPEPARVRPAYPTPTYDDDDRARQARRDKRRSFTFDLDLDLDYTDKPGSLKRKAPVPAPAPSSKHDSHCRCCAERVPDEDAVVESGASMTEMQLLLVHGSRKNDALNVISFAETYKLSDLPRVKQAWERVIMREPALHVEMMIEGDGGIIRNGDRPKFRWYEVHVDNDSDYRAEVDERPCSSVVATGFKVVVRDHGWHQDSIATVIWRIHHALIDGYSASLMYRKFQRSLRGESSPIGTPFIHVARQLRQLQLARADDSKAFWRRQYARYPDMSGEIRLPAPLPGRQAQAKLADVISLSTPVDDLRAICRLLDCTLAAFYSAAWSMVLSRFAACSTVVFGLVYSGRGLPLQGAEDTIGPLINTLPLCVETETEADLSVSSFVQGIFRSMNEVSEYQFTRATDGFSRNFSSAIAMEFDMEPLSDSPVRPVGPSRLSIISDVPLSICIFETGRIQICYRTSIYREADMSMLAEHFEATIAAMMDLERPISYCLDQFVVRPYRNKLLSASNYGQNGTSPGYSSDTLISLFEAVVSSHPDSIALEKGPLSVTYRNLGAAVRRVAYGLRDHISPGEAVCVLADRSVNWIIGIYACMLLGAVYAPIDPNFPAAARDLNFKTSRSKVFLVPDAAQTTLKPASCETCFSVEKLLAAPSGPSGWHAQPYTAEAPAYMCFTSGSTGIPKAVLCAHEGLVAFQRDLQVRLYAAPGQRISQIMSPAFDGSIHEIFSALSYGATLILPALSGDPVEHLHSATCALMTPTLVSALDPAEYPNLKYVYLVGEPVSQAICDEWAGRKELYNMYGPTEATCGATISRLVPGKTVTIGRPNPSSRVYILDGKRRLLPPGVAGEIYIAGVQVARGYVGLAEETRAKFLPDTVCPRLREKMYRTGDFGYWTSTGEICFLGRQDRQVKLRGFRLDLDDLEHRIAQGIPEVEAVAIARQGDWLVALMTPSALDASAMRGKVSAILQPQAIPRHFMAVDELPVTAVGKRDYKAIAALDFVGQVAARTAPTYSGMEAKLAALWREVLDMPHDLSISSEMNFLSLGGDSIRQLVLINRIFTTIGCTLDQRDVLLTTSKGTLGDLAKLIEPAVTGLSSPMSRQCTMVPSEETSLGQTRLSSSETQWFHRYKLDDVHTQFNVSAAWNIDTAKVDVARLTDALKEAVKRHTVFCSTYVQVERTLCRKMQAFDEQVSFVAAGIDIAAEVNRPFDISKDSPIRVYVSPDQVLLVASHITCDLTALRRVLQDAGDIYDGKMVGPVGRCYFATSRSSDDVKPETLAYWNEAIVPAISNRRHLFEEARPSCRGTSTTVNLGKLCLGAVHAIGRQHRLTHHQTLLAAVALSMLRRRSSTDGLFFGGPYLNRKLEDSSTVGLFLEPLPIFIPAPEDGKSGVDVDALLYSVRSASLMALANATSWEAVLHHAGVDQAAASHCMFDAMVTFHGADADGVLPATIPGLSPLMTWSEGAKFRLMLEFTALGDKTLLLRLEYAHASYAEAEIDTLAAEIRDSIFNLAGQVRQDVSSPSQERLADGSTRAHGGLSRVPFGTPLNSIRGDEE